MRDCANCFHRKPVLKEDGTWTAECEKWDCEFLSRENMIEKTEAKGGDLISREALLKEVRENKELYETERVYLEGLILNAPTVHGIVAYVERPKGERVETQRGIHVTDYKCSCCGRTVRDDTGYDVASDYPFCNCGADMRGDKE